MVNYEAPDDDLSASSKRCLGGGKNPLQTRRCRFVNPEIKHSPSAATIGEGRELARFSRDRFGRGRGGSGRASRRGPCQLAASGHGGGRAGGAGTRDSRALAAELDAGDEP